MDKNIYLLLILALSIFGLSACATKKQPVTEEKPLVIAAEKPAIAPAQTTQTWADLQHASLASLNAKLRESKDSETIAWLKLAIISKNPENNTKELINQLIVWRQEHPNHPGNSLFPDDNKLSQLLEESHPKHIALLLPLDGPLGAQGKAVRDGFLSAYYSSAKSQPKPTISFFNTSGATHIGSLYQQAIAQGADMVIGPLTKEHVQQLSEKNHYPVTTLALNYTQIKNPSSQFYQFGLSQKDEAEQLANKAYQAGHSKAIIIAAQDPWIQNITKPVIEQWQSLGGQVIDTYYYSERSHLERDIAKITKQHRDDFDTIFLLAKPQQARIIVPLLKNHYADTVPIYSTSVIYSGSYSQNDATLNGVIFCDIPWIINKPTKSQLSRLYAVGRDAERLSLQLQRLSQLPHFPINADTGTLTLNAKQQIHRQVAWTQIHAGQT